MKRLLLVVAAFVVFTMVPANAGGHTLSKAKAARAAESLVPPFRAVIASKKPPEWDLQEAGVLTCKKRSQHKVDCFLAAILKDNNTGKQIGCIAGVHVSYKNHKSRRPNVKPFGQIQCENLSFGFKG